MDWRTIIHETEWNTVKVTLHRQLVLVGMIGRIFDDADYDLTFGKKGTYAVEDAQATEEQHKSARMNEFENIRKALNQCVDICHEMFLYLEETEFESYVKKIILFRRQCIEIAEAYFLDYSEKQWNEDFATIQQETRRTIKQLAKRYKVGGEEKVFFNLSYFLKFSIKNLISAFKFSKKE